MAGDAELVLVLGNKNLSSWSLRPWLLLRQAGVPFRELVVPFETPGWRTSIHEHSPSGRVPALRHGSFVVWDSLAIAEYVAELFPERRLWPDDREQRALARALSAEMHAGFGNLRSDLSMDVTARFPRPTLSRETEDDVNRIVRLWSESRARAIAASSGPFLFGAFSIADAMFAPVATRFRTYDVPIADALARDYCDHVLALPAMQEWAEQSAAEVAALAMAAAAAGPGRLPEPGSAQHCFAVIFSSKRAAGNDEGYTRDAAHMEELAAKQPGFLGIESARNPDGRGITVSYWDSREAIRAWKDVPAHARVQLRGRTSFYERYEVRVAIVERGYRFPS